MRLEKQLSEDSDKAEKRKTAEIKSLAPWKKSYDKPKDCIKKQRHHFANKGLSGQSYGFSSSHI